MRGSEYVELMDQEAVQRVGDRNAVHQHDREERHQIQHHDDFAGQHAEVFHHHIVNVAIAAGAGKHEAAERAVRQIGQRESEQRHQQQHQRAVQAGVDRQEQRTGAHRSRIETEHPDGVGFVPFGSLSGRQRA